jgi:UDP-N-acetylmuramate--L-alanine ligase/UDP-N-acetylenolpyruvoylglucosamine reductase
MDNLSELLTHSERPLRLHLVGVAGSGMSGLALLLLGMGHRVSGSDRVTTRETERMQGLGLDFYSPHSAEAVKDADVLVYSSAVRADNPERQAAVALGIPEIRRAECLAAILHTRKGIVVAGTHGKTTTSSMAAHILRAGGINPSHYVGAEIPVLGANANWSPEGEHMVAEGDESDGTIALFHPEHAILLNVEADHLDYYRDLEHIREVFGVFLDQTVGKIFYCGEDPVAREMCAARPNAVSYGWSNADYVAENVRELRGVVAYDVTRHGELLTSVELGIPGRHNVLNSLAAIALADTLGVAMLLASRALGTFAGAKRRFETKYLSSQVRIVDDYGHHPTEISATLQTARSLKPGRVVVLFQPHRFTRTQALAAEFGEALQAADLVFVTDIYPAGEVPIPGVSGETIVAAMANHGDTRGVSVPDLRTAHHALGAALQPGDLVITLGAGNVHEAGTRLARDLAVIEELRRIGGEAELDAKLYEPMLRHTTMRVGGPAQYWLEPHTFGAFARVVAYCRERGIPVRVVGRGSNLLVKDGGIAGAVIHPNGGEFAAIRVEGNRVIAGAGVRFKKVAAVAEEAGLGGFEWMEGIPGNVGGGLRMNAGAMGTETFDQVVSVTFLDEDGEIRERGREEIVAAYRNVVFLRRNFALSAVFSGHPDEPAAIRARMLESMAKRRTSQPVAASAGCIFRNPQTVPAGKLVDELGLKGTSHGKARVSLAHGNFIVNEGSASATEVLTLIDEIRARALAERGIELEQEVKIIGEEEHTF